MASLTYFERLATFSTFWDAHQAAARQLAAIGHVCDRPPLEALEEGSRCISCSNFVRRDLSIKALEGCISTARGEYGDGFQSFYFHHPSCIRLQVRIPLDPQALLPGLHGGYRLNDVRSRFERKKISSEGGASGRQSLQTSSLFSLPVELRLEIYAMILPKLDEVSEIVPLNRDSARVVTAMGYDKNGPRNLTKANLLRTCRAIHNEALDLIYNRVTFQFASRKVMYLFLRHIGTRGRRLLKAVDINCGRGQREDAIAFALLASCEKLRAITIRLGRPKLLLPPAPIWMTDGVACMLSLSGLEEVRFGACKSENGLPYMDDSKPDGAIIRRELTRAKGEPCGIAWVNGHLDL